MNVEKKQTLLREMSSVYGAQAGGEIAIYHAPDGRIVFDVRLEKETLWLNLNQIATLFDRDKSVISKHLRNVFRDGELNRDSVVAIFATTATDGKTYEVEYFNFDAIISVGYRVNSRRGTQFRIWATQVLRDHVLQGYSINELRMKELRQSIRLVGQVLDRQDIASNEALALLRVVTDYERALDVLDDYDHQRVRPLQLQPAEAVGISCEEAFRIIDQMREKFGGSELFGREKDNSLSGSLNAIMQTFGGRDVYPGIEEKAAHLLYFLVKNHSFMDGNKRIAAALFLWFMAKNGLLYRPDGTRRIAEAALVGITLMIAESHPEQKELLTRLVVHLLYEES